ncbi:hypothetical protein [Streptomyces chiangmaiensis]|uniref:Uncharacterized protein n=1 Tax=Streptomyces chiangmaiensis TaxID=766497 RepID=A0ABU7FW95_9ACTN|nr:hypothetical protein [Streptomyces chiangmaiensis]MED7828068.1 hypothetical protein [Streptomyces chiangmaiensis]
MEELLPLGRTTGTDHAKHGPHRPRRHGCRARAPGRSRRHDVMGLLDDIGRNSAAEPLRTVFRSNPEEAK